MAMNRHPSNQQLQTWLESGAPARLGKHVDGCERCMALLEELSDLGDTLVAELSDALAAPTDVEDRTARQVESRLRNEAAFTAFLDLFTVGWFATKTILDIEEESDE
jgi:hypothetical protein